jgi:hypothetical protein
MAMFLRKYWIPLSVFIVAIVSVGLYLLMTQPEKPPIKIYKAVKPIEKPKEQPSAEAPIVEQPEHGGHFHADGDPFHVEPHEMLPSTSEAALNPPVSLEAAVWEAKVDEASTKQAPYHPHDDLSPEEHQRVHAELKQYGSKLDDLIRLYEENLTDLQAGRITPEESRNFLESTNPKRDSIIANIKRLQGE